VQHRRGAGGAHADHPGARRDRGQPRRDPDDQRTVADRHQHDLGIEGGELQTDGRGADGDGVVGTVLHPHRGRIVGDGRSRRVLGRVVVLADDLQLRAQLPHAVELVGARRRRRVHGDLDVTALRRPRDALAEVACRRTHDTRAVGHRRQEGVRAARLERPHRVEALQLHGHVATQRAAQLRLPVLRRVAHSDRQCSMRPRHRVEVDHGRIVGRDPGQQPFSGA
jgi:hypothetical protein